MKLKPLSDCVLIKQDIEKQGLIILPESKLFSGIVMAIGPGKLIENGNIKPMELKVGDHVLFGEYSGQKVTHEGEDFLMMREPDVIGTLND